MMSFTRDRMVRVSSVNELRGEVSDLLSTTITSLDSFVACSVQLVTVSSDTSGMTTVHLRAGVITSGSPPPFAGLGE